MLIVVSFARQVVVEKSNGIIRITLNNYLFWTVLVVKIRYYDFMIRKKEK